MTQARSIVLLTGFGPFPGVAENVSAHLVKALAEKARSKFHDHVFVSEVLETEWTTAPGRIGQLVATLHPALALHFGVAREADGFRIERQAANVCRLASDASGRLPAAEKLLQDGADCELVGIDAEAIAAHLVERGYPARVSDDAGGYLCNAVLYHSLKAARERQLATRAGFIHIPADISSPPFDFAAALEGSLEIVGLCLAPRPAQRRS